ncbi:two-partner secretion domain-containing protein [Tolypothrix sp. NIES-4075]|uniref:two-partner secretion domain-containing protein n=1 Tax=Tolypothrix sp. NIES-4075 TaxID=2005459 RepID=UPI001F470B3F|nr:filamentous hemagglutinin N-terminal domain-containing protein [Tolypothrix sp. NIES-4075]
MGRKQGCRLSWVVVLGLAGALNASANVQAQQVVPDTSLPVNSAVTVNGNNFTINGGTQAGRNLFHSFSEFSIPSNGSAFFNNAQTIQNIISRVTGSSVSNIDGILGANGTANLFFLNPNGIVFGPNASLNVGGSFVATTANAIQFGNVGFFSASNPNNPALLTVNPDALFFNQIAASNPNISTTATNLSVRDGRGLFLVGGNINIDSGRLNAFGGRVELGGLTEVGTVGLNLSGNNLSLSFPDAVKRGNVSLTNGAVVDVSGGNNGNIAINAGIVTVSGGANLIANTFGQGSAGSIAIAASDDISISGNNTALGSQVFPLAVGNGGTISLNAPIVRISDNAALIADSQGIGNGGNIAINAAKVTVSNGANLAANTFGQGSAGSIAIAASDDISISGNNTALGSQVFPLAVGNGGTISLNAPIVRISDNAALIADSQGIGNGGNIAINAGIVTVSDGATMTANTFAQRNAGSIAITATDDISINGNNTILGSSQSSRDATGNGGTINLNAPKVMIFGGANLIAHTFGQGNAGNIAIAASDDISINGNNTALSSQVFPDALGKGGTISLNAPIVTISDNAAIIADSQGRGNGSKIAINAGIVTVSDGANLAANTFGQGNAGSIAITATDDISINGNNTILGSSQSSRDATGNGGTINLNAPKVMIFGGANLIAHTFGQGNAGSIAIAASDDISINGNNTALSSQVFPDSVGNGGTISLNAPTVRISDNAAIIADSQGRGNGSKIAINAAKLTVSNGANLAANTFGQGNAGSIAITASDDISIDGGNTALGSQVFGDATGNGGTINLNAPKVTVSDGAALIANTSGQGNAGTITIDAANSLLIDGQGTGLGTQVLGNATGNGGTINLNAPKATVSDGATLIANTSGQGNAGTITIDAANLLIDGQGTGLGTQVLGNATGNGGTINLNAPNVTLSGDADIVANTEAKGNAGTIRIDAANLLIDGQGTGLGTQVLGDATGNGGTINLNAPKVTVSGGADIVANTEAQGNAGTIRIDAKQVFLDGQASDKQPHGIGSAVFESASGNGGQIVINTGSLNLTNNAQLIVSSIGQGTAGEIKIDSDSIRLDNQSGIRATTAFGNGGNISLRAKDLLLLRRGSQISTTAGNDRAGGDGGNITINTPFLIAVPNENSDILANAFTGRGGRVDITATGVYGIESRAQPTLQSDITASSTLGVAGVVEINTPDVDPSRGLIALPALVVNSPELVASECNAFIGKEGSSFTVTGRGGLPPSPDDFLSGDVVWSDTRNLATAGSVSNSTLYRRGLRASTYTAKMPSKTTERIAIIPATGWVFNNKGEVTLISNVSTTERFGSDDDTCLRR